MDTPSLIGSLFRDTSELILVEGKLLRAEMQEAGDRAQSGAVMAGAGILLALIALGVLAAGAVLLLVRLNVAPDIACACIGGVALLLALALILLAVRKLKPSALMPNRTIRQMSSALTRSTP